MSDLDLTKLRYFYAAAQTQHVTKAAETIHIAQPALTHAIKSLESDLGVLLFEKRGRNVVLTEYGVFLKKKLDRILPELDEIPEEIDRLKNQAEKTVRLNILAASVFVIDAIVRYRESHTDVILELEQSAKKDGCDIVIRTDPSDWENDRACIREFCKTERIYLAVPIGSKYAEMDCIDLSQVAGERFVMLSGSRPFRAICDRFCRQAGFDPKTQFESDSPMAVQNIIGTGSGIAFWPEFTWGKMQSEKVKLLPISHPVECSRELNVRLYSRGGIPPNAEASDFFDFLVSRFSAV